MHFPLPKSLFGFRKNESHHVKYVSMAISRAPRYCSEKPAINTRLALYVGVCVCVIKCGPIAHGDVDFALPFICIRQRQRIHIASIFDILCMLQFR